MPPWYEIPNPTFPEGQFERDARRVDCAAVRLAQGCRPTLGTISSAAAALPKGRRIATAHAQHGLWRGQRVVLLVASGEVVRTGDAPAHALDAVRQVAA